MIVKKSDKTADMMRRKALNLISKGELHESLILLNKSLCLAELKSKITAEIYKNRAEVFYELNFFDKCLHDISLARSCRCISINDELKELEQNCFENLDQQVEEKNPWEFFKLSHKSHSHVPFVVDCLEVRRDEHFGRHVVTTRELAAGEILAIEEPFFRYLKTDPDDIEYPETNAFNYCTNCLNDNHLNLVPCPGCTKVMFCSQKCLVEGLNNFHQYECGLNDELNEIGNWRMPLRSFFVSLSICGGSIKKLKDFMRISDLKNPTILDYDMREEENEVQNSDCEISLETSKDEPKNLKIFNGKSQIISENYLKSMIALTHNTNVPVIKDFTSIFNNNPFLKDLWSTHKDFINEYIIRMHQIEILNFHGIKGRSLKRKDCCRRCVGDGSYAFCSLLNHSCCPNVMRIVFESRMVLIVERPIKAFEQIFDCYIGDSYYFKGKKYRQEELEDYNFSCECLACVNQYPDLVSGLLKINDINLLKDVQKEYNKLQDPRRFLMPNEAKELSKVYSKLLNESYDSETYPSREIVLLQLCIVKCFLTAAKSSILFP